MSGELLVSIIEPDDGTNPFYMMDWGPELEQLGDLTRRATVAELVEALKEEGALVRECSEITGYGGELIAHPGRFLLFPMEDDPAENPAFPFEDVT